MSVSYGEYLQSKHWKKLAEETKRLAGNRCQVCNSTENLAAHHRTYERKGDELQSDLTCLCNKCHERFHDDIVYSELARITQGLKYLAYLCQEDDEIISHIAKVLDVKKEVLLQEVGDSNCLAMDSGRVS